MPSLASTSAYLDQLYKDKFGRQPDAEGKAYWQGQIDSGKATAASVAAAFDASSEAKDRVSKGVAQGVADTASFEAAKAANAAKAPAPAPAPAPSPAPAPYNAAEAYNNTVNSTVAAFNAPAPAPSPAPAPAPSPAPAPDDDDGPVYTLPYIDPESEQGKRLAINDIYRDVLERNSDEGGEDYWYKELESGRQTLDDIRSNIEASSEKDKLADNKAFIEQQYNQGLDRGTGDNIDDAADPYGGGMGYWLKDLATGQSRDDVAANIRRSDEFSTQASDYLEGLYENILERDPDTEGLDYWKQSLIDGTQTREDVENNFNISDEKWLGDIYKNELGRNLGEEGRDYWLNDINNKGQSREDVLANIKRSDEYACAQSGGTWDGSSCTQAPTACPAGQVRNANGDCEDTDLPIVCGAGQQLNSAGTGCIDIPEIPDDECPTGQRRNAAGNCETDPNTLPCGEGETRGADGVCRPVDTTPAPCPSGQTRNAQGQCVGSDAPAPGPAPCPNGQTRNPDGSCPEAGTYMGEDPQDKIDTEGKAPGTWMGNQESDDDFNRLYNDKQAEMVRLYGGDGQGGTASNDRYDQLKSDYDDARREADSYINANRDEELSKLRRGITVGGFPGSRRNDLRSGGTAYSDRSRKRSRVTAGPRVKNDRPYAARGVRGGYSSGSTYFDNASSF